MALASSLLPTDEKLTPVIPIAQSDVDLSKLRSELEEAIKHNYRDEYITRLVNQGAPFDPKTILFDVLKMPVGKAKLLIPLFLAKGALVQPDVIRIFLERTMEWPYHPVTVNPIVAVLQDVISHAKSQQIALPGNILTTALEEYYPSNVLELLLSITPKAEIRIEHITLIWKTFYTRSPSITKLLQLIHAKTNMPAEVMLNCCLINCSPTKEQFLRIIDLLIDSGIPCSVPFNVAIKTAWKECELDEENTPLLVELCYIPASGSWSESPFVVLDAMGKINHIELTKALLKSGAVPTAAIIQEVLNLGHLPLEVLGRLIAAAPKAELSDHLFTKVFIELCYHRNQEESVLLFMLVHTIWNIPAEEIFIRVLNEYKLKIEDFTKILRFLEESDIPFIKDLKTAIAKARREGKIREENYTLLEALELLAPSINVAKTFFNCSGKSGTLDEKKTSCSQNAELEQAHLLRIQNKTKPRKGVLFDRPFHDSSRRVRTFAIGDLEIIAWRRKILEFYSNNPYAIFHFDSLNELKSLIPSGTKPYFQYRDRSGTLDVKVNADEKGTSKRSLRQQLKDAQILRVEQAKKKKNWNDFYSVHSKLLRPKDEVKSVSYGGPSGSADKDKKLQPSFQNRKLKQARFIRENMMKTHPHSLRHGPLFKGAPPKLSKPGPNIVTFKAIKKRRKHGWLDVEFFSPAPLKPAALINTKTKESFNCSGKSGEADEQHHLSSKNLKLKEAHFHRHRLE